VSTPISFTKALQWSFDHLANLALAALFLVIARLCTCEILGEQRLNLQSWGISLFFMVVGWFLVVLLKSNLFRVRKVVEDAVDARFAATLGAVAHPDFLRIVGNTGKLWGSFPEGTARIGERHLVHSLCSMLTSAREYGLDACQSQWDHIPFNCAMWLLDSLAALAEDNFHATYLLGRRYNGVYKRHGYYFENLGKNHDLDGRRFRYLLFTDMDGKLLGDEARIMTDDDLLRQYVDFARYNQKHHGIEVLPIPPGQVPQDACDAEGRPLDFAVFDMGREGGCVSVSLEMYTWQTEEIHFPARFMINAVRIGHGSGDRLAQLALDYSRISPEATKAFKDRLLQKAEERGIQCQNG